MATIELTSENFERSVEKHETLIVDFWASWCGPCRAFAPTFEKASDKHPDLAFGKVDTDAQEELAAAFGIQSIPTLMVFKAQTIIYRDSGALPPPILDKLIEQVRALSVEEIVAKRTRMDDDDDDDDENENELA